MLQKKKKHARATRGIPKYGFFKKDLSLGGGGRRHQEKRGDHEKKGN